MTRIDMESFHKKSLQQWLAPSKIQFAIMNQPMYVTRNNKKLTTRIIAVLCSPNDCDGLTKQLESISETLPWTYYNTKMFNKFSNETKYKRFKKQNKLNRTSRSYLIPGFKDNDTIYMSYRTQDTIDASASGNTPSVTTPPQAVNEDDAMADEEDVKPAAVSDTTEDQGNISPIGLPVPDDYVGDFMEDYYEYEHHVYVHVGPVVDNQREVWVLNHNSMYAEDLNKIIIGDLSLHMTADACKLCLDESLVATQLVLAETLIPRSLKDYMTMKYDPEDSDSEDEMGQVSNNGPSNREPAQKRPRHDDQQIVTQNGDDAKANSTETADDYKSKIDLLEQQLKLTSEKVDTLTNASHDAAIEARFKSIQDAMATQSSDIGKQLTAHATEMTTTMLSNIELSEIKTNNRIKLVYDAIATNNIEIDTKFKLVSEEIQENNIENRAENKKINSKLDKLLLLVDKKSTRKMKSLEIAKQFNQTLMHHTGESEMEDDDDDF